MKKGVWIFVMMFYGALSSQGQSFEAQQLLLDVQKLSGLKQMLTDLKKGYDIVYKGYTTIKTISQGNFNLHQVFLDGLLQVSPAVRGYKKVADIITLDQRILSEYTSAFRQFRDKGGFTPSELAYIGKVYAHLLGETTQNLETLTMILTPGTLRMSDDERLKQIDTLYEDTADQLSFLRQFNNGAAVLSLQRTRGENQVRLSKKIYGLPD